MWVAAPNVFIKTKLSEVILELLKGLKIIKSKYYNTNIYSHFFHFLVIFQRFAVVSNNSSETSFRLINCSAYIIAHTNSVLRKLKLIIRHLANMKLEMQHIANSYYQ